jgi:hypothetical protein
MVRFSSPNGIVSFFLVGERTREGNRGRRERKSVGERGEGNIYVILFLESLQITSAVSSINSGNPYSLHSLFHGLHSLFSNVFFLGQVSFSLPPLPGTSQSWLVDLSFDAGYTFTNPVAISGYFSLFLFFI